MSWGHEDLQHDLATTRRDAGEIAVERLSIGSYGGGGQIDVFALRPSWTGPMPTVYEVKISRADFLRDTQAGKYQRYLPYCRRLYFATPEGMVHRKEVPEGTGLCVRGERGWRTVAAPRVRPEPEGWPEILFSLLLKIHPGPWDKPTRAERIRATAQAMELRTVGRGTAPKVAAALRELDDTRGAIASAHRQLCDALGVPDTDPRDLWHLATAIRNLAPTKLPPKVAEVKRGILRAKASIEQAERAVDAMAAAEEVLDLGAA